MENIVPANKRTKKRPRSTTDKLEIIPGKNGKNDKCMHKCTEGYERNPSSELCILTKNKDILQAKQLFRKPEFIRATKRIFNLNEPINLSLLIENNYKARVYMSTTNAFNQPNRNSIIHKERLQKNPEEATQTISVKIPEGNNDNYMFVQLLWRKNDENKYLIREWYVASVKRSANQIRIGKFVSNKQIENNKKTARKAKKQVMPLEGNEEGIMPNNITRKRTRGNIEMMVEDHPVGEEKSLSEPISLRITNSLSRNLEKLKLIVRANGKESILRIRPIQTDSDIIIDINDPIQKDGNIIIDINMENRNANKLTYEFELIDFELQKTVSVYTCTFYILNDGDLYYRRLVKALKRKPIPRKKTNKIVPLPTNNEEVVENPQMNAEEPRMNAVDGEVENDDENMRI